jgi:hypothetical protein
MVGFLCYKAFYKLEPGFYEDKEKGLGWHRSAKNINILSGYFALWFYLIYIYKSKRKL